MKKTKSLLSLILAFAMMFALAACGGTKAGDDAGDGNPPQSQQTVQDDSKQPEATPEPDPVVENSFDAASAVTVEQLDNGVKYTFSTLPQTAEDIQALIDVYPVTDRHNTVAFFMASLVRYIEDTQEGLAMIDVLKGPQKLSDTDKAFIKERFSDKQYLPKAYFEGAQPANNYEPDSPWTLIIYDDPVNAPEGYTYVNVKTSGADNPRRICLRLKGEENWLWEYNGVFMSIRLPSDEDPWR